jgi:hypothetical protein
VPVVAAALADYDQNGVHHYVFPVAQVNADGTVTDMRPKGSLAQQQSNNDFMRKAANLGDLVDKAAARNVLGWVAVRFPGSEVLSCPEERLFWIFMLISALMITQTV